MNPLYHVVEFAAMVAVCTNEMFPWALPHHDMTAGVPPIAPGKYVGVFPQLDMFLGILLTTAWEPAVSWELFLIVMNTLTMRGSMHCTTVAVEPENPEFNALWNNLLNSELIPMLLIDSATCSSKVTVSTAS